MRTDPRTFDAFAREYDRFTELFPGDAHDRVRSMDLRGGRALDAGCGAGRQTAILSESFDDVVGIDISPPLIDLARTKRPRHNVRYEVADLTTFTDADGFDLVFTSTALHHVDDLDVALDNLKRLTFPGGTIVAIDCVSSIWTRRSPRAVYTIGAVLDFARDLRRIGLRDALWMARFQFTQWIPHLLTDRYLSRDEFERRYGAAFPGARFDHFGFAACIWTKP